MMTTIVVPLDGSEFAERALRPACALAARLDDARVLLVSCTPGDEAVVQAHLDDRVELFASVVDLDTRVLVGVGPAEGIVQTVASTPGALLCMATHGRGGLRGAVLGSVANNVVVQTSSPIVLVGPTVHTALVAGEQGRLLVCSDGSGFSDSIIHTAATWAARLQLQPCVAEVVGPDEDVAEAGDPVRNRQVEAATRRLEALASRLHTPSSTARLEVLHGTPTSRSIVEFAGRLPAALIAMATHGRTGLARSALGSVASDVVRHAPCPVLLARPIEAAGS